jgi:lipoate-protein ligase B
MINTNAVKLDIIDLGTKPYAEVLDLQLDLCQKRQTDEIDNTVLIVEHPAVISLGARKSENKLLADEGLIREQGIELVRAQSRTTGVLPYYQAEKLKTGCNRVYTISRAGRD